MPTARLRLPTHPLPPRIHQAVLSWIQSLHPSDLEAVAAADGSLTELIRRQFPMIPVGFVQAILTPEERDALSRLDARAFDALLDGILAEAPEAGEILWAHRDWYLREIAALRDAVVGS